MAVSKRCMFGWPAALVLFVITANLSVLLHRSIYVNVRTIRDHESAFIVTNTDHQRRQSSNQQRSGPPAQQRRQWGIAANATWQCRTVWHGQAASPIADDARVIVGEERGKGRDYIGEEPGKAFADARSRCPASATVASCGGVARLDLNRRRKSQQQRTSSRSPALSMAMATSSLLQSYATLHWNIIHGAEDRLGKGKMENHAPPQAPKFVLYEFSPHCEAGPAAFPGLISSLLLAIVTKRALIISNQEPHQLADWLDARFLPVIDWHEGAMDASLKRAITNRKITQNVLHLDDGGRRHGKGGAECIPSYMHERLRTRSVARADPLSRALDTDEADGKFAQTLLCSNVMDLDADILRVRASQFFAPLLWHNPVLRGKHVLEHLGLVPGDVYGPLHRFLLQPVPTVVHATQNFVASHFFGNRGDEGSDARPIHGRKPRDSYDPAFIVGMHHSTFHRVASPELPSFFEVCAHALLHADGAFQGSRGRKLFLVSDDVDFVSQMQVKLRDQVIMFKPQTIMEVELASVIEWLLLGECDDLIVAGGSSVSYGAHARSSRAPISVFSTTSKLHHASPHASTCARALSPDPCFPAWGTAAVKRSTCYDSGTMPAPEDINGACYLFNDQLPDDEPVHT